MSSLFRQPTQEYDAEAAQPLVDRSTIDDDFSAFRSAANDEDRHNVTYVFAPEWPVPGREEQIVGILGRDKDVCYPLHACSAAVWIVDEIGNGRYGTKSISDAR